MRTWNEDLAVRSRTRRDRVVAVDQLLELGRTTDHRMCISANSANVRLRPGPTISTVITVYSRTLTIEQETRGLNGQINYIIYVFAAQFAYYNTGRAPTIRYRTILVQGARPRKNATTRCHLNTFNSKTLVISCHSGSVEIAPAGKTV